MDFAIGLVPVRSISQLKIRGSNQLGDSFCNSSESTEEQKQSLSVASWPSPSEGFG